MKNIFESNTKLRELVAEYRMLSDLALYAAARGKELQIARLEHDTFGYDVILKVDGSTKFVQLKSRMLDGKAPHWDIHRTLIENQDGTVVLLLIDYKPDSIALSYRVMNEGRRQEILSKKPIIERGDDKKCKISIGDFNREGDIGSLYSELFSQ
jgi:hypothetical protein